MPTMIVRGKLNEIDYLILDNSISTSLRVFWNNYILACSITSSYCSIDS